MESGPISASRAEWSCGGIDDSAHEHEYAKQRGAQVEAAVDVNTRRIARSLIGA